MMTGKMFVQHFLQFLILNIRIMCTVLQMQVRMLAAEEKIDYHAAKVGLNFFSMSLACVRIFSMSV